jgi:transporter family-2 protein
LESPLRASKDHPPEKLFEADYLSGLVLRREDFLPWIEWELQFSFSFFRPNRFNFLMPSFWILFAAAAGACISVQSAANGSLRLHLDDARWATFFSICGTIATAVLMMLILRPNMPSSAQFRSAPWWNWIGGPLGATIVFSGAFLTPKLGAASFIAAVVGGQILSSIFLDHFALMNLPHHPISLSRLIGAVLVFTGVLLVTRN